MSQQIFKTDVSESDDSKKNYAIYLYESVVKDLSGDSRKYACKVCIARIAMMDNPDHVNFIEREVIAKFRKVYESLGI